jgi:hypothetical protein
LPWIGGWAALAAITVVIGIVVARTDPAVGEVTAAVAPAVAAPVAPVEAPVEPLPIAPESPQESVESTDGAIADADAENAALAQQKAAEARERKKARQRLAEIEKENQAVARRQEEELIQRLLAAAKQAYAVGAYTRPAGDSAADRYREILGFRPNHADATAGLRKIADLRAEEARRALAVGDANKVRGLIDDIGKLQPDHPTLTDLQVGIATLEGSPQPQDRRQAVALERADRHIQKAYRHLDRKPFDLKAADLATDEYDNAVAQMPMAPDLPALKERLMASYSEIVRAEIRDTDTKGALRMIGYARKRKWMTAELEELELAARQAPPEQALGSK